MQHLKLKCWWCNKRLMKISHATVEVDGYNVRVHKGCKPDAEKDLKIITARERKDE